MRGHFLSLWGIAKGSNSLNACKAWWHSLKGDHLSLPSFEGVCASSNMRITKGSVCLVARKMGFRHREYKVTVNLLKASHMQADYQYILSWKKPDQSPFTAVSWLRSDAETQSTWLTPKTTLSQKEHWFSQCDSLPVSSQCAQG